MDSTTTLIKLAIVGSRTFSNYDLLTQEVASLGKEIKITHVISGCAKGADQLGERYAKSNGIPIIPFKPNWKKFGKKAGILRNQDIVKEADMVLAFWDGKSSGTRHTIEYAQKMGVPVKRVKF